MRTIGREQVAGIGLTMPKVISAMESAFAAAASGDIVWRPKATINQPDGAFFIGTFACWPKAGFGIFHNIMGTAPGNVPHGAPHYSTLQVLSDYRTAKPAAIVDGTFTSNMLPAGLTAIVAKRLGKAGSRIATFVGAGVQARVNLDAVRLAQPIEEVRVLSRTAASADAFAKHVASLGLKARVETDPETAVRGADIIVTSVPSSVGLKPFLDPAWVSPGALISAVDVGRCWKPGFEAFDRMVTDNREQAVVSHKEGRMLYSGTFDTELPELVTGLRPGRQSPKDRIAVIHPGDIVGVFGITLEIFKAVSVGGR